MTDNITHINLDDEQFEDAPKALRDYAAKLKKALDAAHGEAGQLRSQLASKSLGDVLGTKGFKNPKAVEKSLLADKVDPLDESAVAKWLEENSDDFAKAEGTPGEPNQPATQQLTPEQQADAEARAQAYAAMQQVNGSLVQPADVSKFELAQSEIKPEHTKEEVRAILLKHGL